MYYQLSLIRCDETLFNLGSYCIYRQNWLCPYGMIGGSITWDDEDIDNKNSNGGHLPDLQTDTSFGSSALYYCCQNKREWYKPIKLPTEIPFYLLPFQSKNCQRVKWAVSSLEYIIYDTEDYQNGDLFYKYHVYTDETKSLPKMFYCYYEGTDYIFLKFFRLICTKLKI